MKSLLFSMLAVISTALFFSCAKEESPPYTNPATIISSHTAGMISRDASIKVVFYNNMVAEEKIGRQLEESPFQFDPGIPGQANWLNSRTLEFRPDERLKGGETYHTELDLSKLVAEMYQYSTFKFNFTAIRQTFAIRVAGLQAVKQTDLKDQLLTGDLVTADTENGIDIEKILTAKQDDRDLTVQWKHDSDRRNHSFKVTGIIRAERESALSLNWDGLVIDVDNSGSQAIKVPALGSFEISDIRAVQDKAVYIEVVFSDPLQTDQNLRGLISTKPAGDLRFEIILNTIRVYSTGRWSGEITVTVDPAIKNIMGYRLGTRNETKITFENLKPQVRFVGKGIIIPTINQAKINVETVNLNAVIVEAMQIYEKNIPQFLQVNALSGEYQLERVGNVVWQDTIALNLTPDKLNRWIRYGLDLNPLIKKFPRGMYRLSVYFAREHIEYICADEQQDETESSRYDRWSDYYRNRQNPCHPAYYQKYYDHDIRIDQNVLISDIGLIAKQGTDGKCLVIVTDLRTGEPVSGTEVYLYNYQHKELSRHRSDDQGMVIAETEERPFLVIARHGDQMGYLKLDDGSALPVSHFDVGGQTLAGGLKGFIYEERGVWRPGDNIFLTFILYDPKGKIPQNHPAKLEFYNSRNQLVKTVMKKESVNGFYDFRLKTSSDDPTGTWWVKIQVGGALFEKKLKIETIMPNRLDVDLSFGGAKYLQGGALRGELFAQWLHGGTARNLKADIEVGFKSIKTHFDGYQNYNFDDPARIYQTETFKLYEGKLDATGKMVFTSKINIRNTPPGMLSANFSTRVYENSGAFSVEQMSMPFHPYKNYVGIYLPALSEGGNRILTDSSHTVQLALLNQQGAPVKSGTLEINVYKIEWRWWWERGERSLADYVETAHFDPVITDNIEINDGLAVWQLKIPGPSWNRYLVRIRDKEGGHQTGIVLYAYSRGWRGKDQDKGAEGITVLNLTTDKKEYVVNEKVALTIPSSTNGRGLVSVENGSGVLQTYQIRGTGKPIQFELNTSDLMVPNVYISVIYWQPHEGINNDLPIRMYGIIPIKVYNPETRIYPKITIDDVLKPESTSQITISEKNGKPITYTIAIVDEGLLNLTNFKTPDPWNHFYQREALGVRSWDLFDHVAGAYGAAWERLLAIGGGDEISVQGQKKADRFPPMVIYLGPFSLKKDEQNTHKISIPQYVGSARVMVIAAQNDAFGMVDKKVAVRKPLMILGTLPRVLSPDELVDLPLAVFAMEKSVRDVTARVQTDENIKIVGPSQKKLTFSETGDQMVMFKLQIGQNTGISRIEMTANGNGEDAEHDIEIDVRQVSLPVTDVYHKTLQQGDSWKQEITFPGIPGTNSAMLEVSRIPPLNLGRRLNFLIRYPHGCVEQTTSAAFPQLYLPKIMKLTEEQQKESEKNVKRALDRLHSFQTANGGFSYWPGQFSGDDWSSNYAGHFMIESQNMGFAVPSVMVDKWIRYQKNHALSWVTGPKRSALIQAYRLYTLALAGKAELGAMNRLREEKNLPNTAKWRLAAAYYLAGRQDAARNIAEGASLDTEDYSELSYTYGSGLRDKAMILEALCIIGDTDNAVDLVESISEQLCSEKWLSTQTTAYALIAMARFAGITRGNLNMQFSFTWNDAETQTKKSGDVLTQIELDVNQLQKGHLRLSNGGEVVIYPRIIVEGIPKTGTETAAENGIALKVDYRTPEGASVLTHQFEQGRDYMVQVMVKNIGTQGKYEELALSHLMPSGFEIRNTRMREVDGTINSDFEYRDIRDDRVYTYFDLESGETKTFQLIVNASYAGRFYLPMVSVEAMYDATINARVPGKWVEVIIPGTE